MYRQKVIVKKLCWRLEGHWAGSGSVGQRYGSGDPDLYENFPDPEHWLTRSNLHFLVAFCGIIWARILYLYQPNYNVSSSKRKATTGSDVDISNQMAYPDVQCRNGTRCTAIKKVLYRTVPRMDAYWSKWCREHSQPPKYPHSASQGNWTTYLRI